MKAATANSVTLRGMASLLGSQFFGQLISVPWLYAFLKV